MKCEMLVQLWLFCAHAISPFGRALRGPRTIQMLAYRSHHRTRVPRAEIEQGETAISRYKTIAAVSTRQVAGFHACVFRTNRARKTLMLKAEATTVARRVGAPRWRGRSH